MLDESRIDPSGLIVGLLAVATVIAAESTRQETYPKLFLASVVAIGLYWLSYGYARHWTWRLNETFEWTVGEIWNSLVHESTVLAGSAIPFAVLALGWAAGWARETTVTAVLWCAIIELILLEIVTALRRRQSVRSLLVQTAMGVVMGLGILAMRVLLH